MRENLTFRETRKIVARVDRKEVVYINHVIESYDGIMMMTTVNPEEAKVEFNISPYLYKEAEDVAREEGFDEIADQFKEIAEVEEEHEKRYRKLLANVKASKVFKREQEVKWHCRNCGYVHEGDTAPEVCPACAHPQAHYEVLAENY